MIQSASNCYLECRYYNERNRILTDQDDCKLSRELKTSQQRENLSKLTNAGVLINDLGGK